MANNLSEDGWWDRIADAAEALGGTTVEANPGRAGQLRRVAIGLEGFHSTAPKTVSSRTALASVATPTAGQVANLTEAGREGTFVFSTANLSAQVAADTLQGIYIAPLSNTTGASGAWVRKYLGPVSLEWFGAAGNGLTDDKAAFDAATALLTGCTVQLQAKTYAFSLLSIPTDTNVIGMGRGATTILITGDGGGAPDFITNGGVQMFGIQCALRDLTLSFNNASLQCLLNVSGTALSANGRIDIANIDFTVGVSGSSCIGAYLANLVEFTWVGGQIGSAPNFKQQLVMRGFFNGCRIDAVTFRPNASNIASGIFWDALPQVDMDAATRSCSLNDCTWEQGPNGLRAAGGGNMIVKNPYMADAAQSLGFWMPGLTVAQGDYIYPSSVQTTGSIVTATSTTTLNVASAASLYVNQLIGIPGAGAAGANLMTRISAISGTTVTIATAASTDVTAVNIYAGAYAFHGYRAMTAGTTGASLPTFPTTSLATVVDNTTTWREYGGCAWINGDPTGATSAKDVLMLQGGNLFYTIAGVVSCRAGGFPPHSISINGTEFFRTDVAGVFESIGSTKISGGALLWTLANYGFEFRSAVGGSWDNYVSTTIRTAFTGPSVVIGTNNANMGGTYIGSDTVAGIGKARWNWQNPQSLAVSFPGTVAATGAVSATATVTATGTVTSNGTAGGIGYSTGAGSVAIQATSKSTGVTLQRPCGKITMNAAALAAATSVGFTFTNSTIAATDVVQVSIASGATADSYTVTVDAVAAGSCRISLRNISAGSLSEAVVLNFAVIKAVQA